MSQSSPEEIRAEIERTRAALSGNVDELTHEANPKTIARRKVDNVKDSAVGLKDKVMGSSKDAYDSVGDHASDAPGAIKSKTRGNPLAAGLIAFGAGLLLGGLIPVSEKEQEASASLKKSAEPVTQQLTDAAKDIGANLQAPAQDAAAAVKDKATDAAQNVKETGQDAAGDVKSQADHAKDQVQQTR